MAGVDAELKKIGVRMKVGNRYLGVGESTPKIEVAAAKRETVKLFKKKLAENPNLVADMMKKLPYTEKVKVATAVGCKSKLRGIKAEGGRIGFALGSGDLLSLIHISEPTRPY